MSTGDVYRALWRRKLFIVLATAVVGVAAWYGLSRLAPMYEASTLVRVEPPASSAGDPASLEAAQTLARTYTQIVSSGALDDRVRELAGGGRRSTPAVDVSAQTVQDLDLFWISARSRTAAGAARVAEVAPRALRELVSAGSAGAGRARSIVVVKPAQAPSSPSSPSMELDLALAIFVGLVFNGALALLLELSSDRLPDTAHLERVFGRPVLGTVPSVDLVSLKEGTRPAAPPAARAGTGEERSDDALEPAHG